LTIKVVALQAGRTKRHSDLRVRGEPPKRCL